MPGVKNDILFSSLNLLNKRNEHISKCRHDDKYHLANFKKYPTADALFYQNLSEQN